MGKSPQERALWAVEGYPLRLDEDWLLIQETVDFHLDGYTLVRTRDLAGVRYGSGVEGLNRIFRQEGIRSAVEEPVVLDTSSTQAV